MPTGSRAAPPDPRPARSPLRAVFAVPGETGDAAFAGRRRSRSWTRSRKRFAHFEDRPGDCADEVDYRCRHGSACCKRPAGDDLLHQIGCRFSVSETVRFGARNLALGLDAVGGRRLPSAWLGNPGQAEQTSLSRWMWPSIKRRQDESGRLPGATAAGRQRSGRPLISMSCRPPSGSVALRRIISRSSGVRSLGRVEDRRGDHVVELWRAGGETAFSFVVERDLVLPDLRIEGAPAVGLGVGVEAERQQRLPRPRSRLRA